MIDLNEYKEKAEKYFQRIMIEVMPQDVVEICERAIAAESERDELKAKLAELDAQETEVMNDRDYYHEIADKLSAAIADIYQQDIGEHSSANCPWLKALELHEEYELPKPSAPAQRITEQDAREIALSYMHFVSSRPIAFNDFNCWIDKLGRTLLAKLNENREPVQESQPLAPNDSEAVQPLFWLWEHSNGNFGNDLFVSEAEARSSWEGFSKDGKAVAVYRELVTANNAEVPVIELTDKEQEKYDSMLETQSSWIKSDFDKHVLKMIIKQNFSGNGLLDSYPALQFAKAVRSLPPLKDGE